MPRMRFVTLVLLAAALSAAAQTTDPPPFEPELKESEWVKLPTNAILIKGAEPSASDSSTPLPEGGAVVKDVYRNEYFGLTYPLPDDWSENFSGPPPSDSGMYVLALAGPGPKFKGTSRATLLIQAHDLFFSLSDARDAMELAAFAKDTLEPHYTVERSPTAVKIANRPFVRFDYQSEVAGLHWVVLTTEIRCHAVQFIFSSSDKELIERLIKDMDRMQVTTGKETPRCVVAYAVGSNVTNRVEPVMQGSRRFNPIPVRVIIDTRGRPRHIHMINAFPEQAASIQEALMQWSFKPYEENGERVEVETGILFGYTHPWPKRLRQVDGQAVLGNEE